MLLPFALLSSPWEWMVVLAVFFLLFDNRLPSAMRSLGQGMNEFKRGLEEGSKEPPIPPAPPTKQVEDAGTKVNS